jgi:hypothetical protein
MHATVLRRGLAPAGISGDPFAGTHATAVTHRGLSWLRPELTVPPLGAAALIGYGAVQVVPSWLICALCRSVGAAAWFGSWGHAGASSRAEGARRPLPL